MLDEISLDHSPHSPHLYIHSENSSKNNYDQFFEEVSLDLPRESAPSKLMKFMPRRTSPSESMTITSSDVSGPFYSISDVLDDTTNTAAAAAAEAAVAAVTSSAHDANEINRKNRGARRNVNEADVIVTSGGTSIMKNKPTLNPFKRSKSLNQKPSLLDTVISKTRPRMLPPKDPQEEKKHLQEHEAMMKKSKKLEAKKQKEISRKREEKDKKVSQAIQLWETDIIPKWNVRIQEKKTILLWDQGVPPRCRRKVWKLKIGNKANITKETWTESLRRTPIVEVRKPKRAKPIGNPQDIMYKQRRRTSSLDVLREKADEENYVSNIEAKYESSEEEDEVDSESGGRPAMEIDFVYDQGFLDEKNINERECQDEDEDRDSDSLYMEDDHSIDEDQMIMLNNSTAINFLNKAIDEDILRTLPSLCVFQPDGPLFVSLRRVLQAYVGYRPSLSYPKGTSFLAGVLLLNMGTVETFSSLINMINSSDVLSSLYNSDEKRIQGFFKVFNVIFAENFPKLYLHFKNLTLTPENYLPDWFMTIFASIVPLELSSRLWDIYLLHGDIILFRTGLVVLKYLEPLLWGSGFSETVRILNMGFVGEHKGEEVKAALAVSGHITEGDDDPFFDEILGKKGVQLDENRFKELIGAHMPKADVVI
ncbi:rab-GTPase-TBC domain-containing protein [Sporodiniella umbellata]|nr:rab-GTPase-TBC domain-containing protein [Sporodiniella umbellata]